MQLASQVFLEAANYIEEYGWQRSGMSEHGKPRCSMGVLSSVWPKTISNIELGKLMYDSLYKELGGMSLTEFNEQAISGEDVALLFLRVANGLRREATMTVSTMTTHSPTRLF